MSESVATQPKLAPTRRAASDAYALAHVEKWMAMICEISREQQGQRKAARLTGALKPVTK